MRTPDPCAFTMVMFVTLLAFVGGNAPSHGQAAPCEPMPNGSFTAGFDGWTVTPSSSQSGDAIAFQSADIIDGTVMFPPLDEQSAQVFVSSYAMGLPRDKDDGGSAAAGQIVLSMQTSAANRFLRFRTAGGFEILRAGAAETSLSARIEIHGLSASGGLIEHSIDELTPPPFGACEFGMSILGTFAADAPFLIDLFEQGGKPTGIEPGEDIAIDIIVSTSASSATICDEGHSIVVLVIDQFEFCPSHSSVPGDVTGDGHVNVDDLLTVIEGWGQCPSPPTLGLCQADLTEDGVVNVDDLLEVISNWQG